MAAAAVTGRVTRLPVPLRRFWPQAKLAYTAMAGVVSAPSALLAHLTAHGGPRGVAETIEDALIAGGEGARMWVVRDPEPIRRTLPAGHPERHPAMVDSMAGLVSRGVVALLPEARLSGRFGAVINRDGDLVYELSPYFGINRAGEHPIFLRPFRRRPMDFDGVLASLSTRGDDNFYHFMIDVLPRLAWLEECEGAAPFDAIYVPTNRGYQRELLDLVGVTNYPILDSRDHPHVRARQALIPGLPDAHLQTPPWVVNWLRERLLPSELPTPSRRLYITRPPSKGTRVVSNEVAVSRVLERHGYEPVDPGTMTVGEQIEVFASATAIVAPHGAALANLTFASPGVDVLELFAPDYVNPCYRALSEWVPGTRYRYLVGIGHTPKRSYGVTSDIEVDIDVLERMLDEG